ncbi:MAG: ABC transporter ATP-binding protein [Ruthenibacterium sp.]
MNKMLALTKINKEYHMGENRLHVLKDITFSVEAGEFVSILGASGSGKSTLMNIIGCMDIADSGAYLLDGQDVMTCTDTQLAALRNQKIGFIFQKYHLLAQYTVLQNVMMPLLVRGLTSEDAAPLARQSILQVGLDARLAHRPSELSGGQQQRVAIARALVTRPALLLADEPTGALDSATGKEILALFCELNRAGNTIVQITHDLRVAQSAGRMVQLSDGVLLSSASSWHRHCV